MTPRVHTARWLLSAAWRAAPRKLLAACVLLLLGHLATPAVALALRSFTDRVLADDLGPGLLVGGVIALILVAELMLGHFAHLYYFEVGEQAEAQVNADLIGYANGSPGMEHLDSSGFADAVILVREEVQKLRGYLEALLQLSAMVVQLILTTLILASLEPWLLLLPLGALPPVLMGRYAQRLVNRSRIATAADLRRARHLLHVATSATSAKEVRIFGAERALRDRHDAAWQRATRQLVRGRVAGAGLRALGQIAFTLACCGAIYLVLRNAVAGTVTIGDVVLTITLAVQLNVQVGAGLGMLSTLQAAGNMVARLNKLRGWSAQAAANTAAANTAAAGEARPTAKAEPTADEGPTRTAPPQRTAAVPSSLEGGIRLENVGFTYPGTDRTVLRDVTLDLPAGGTIALVGENGAGKSTLVKLLCGLYQPTQGRILVDGTDLRELDPRAWQARVGSLFQDFAKFEFTLRENVGLGDLERLDQDEALLAGLRTAGAEHIVRRVPGGLDGALGHGYTDGAELSGGQWQSLGLARASLREGPLLQILDEPAAALDAAAEHAVFERFAGAARQVGDDGGATVFVSHRFSTVRMADRIAVLDGGSVRECGSHAELMAHSGLYADLFTLQARGYG